VEDSLTLTAPALEVARLAILPDRRHVSRNGPPSPNLPHVV